MFGRMGVLEIAVILGVVLLVIGPKRLPDAAKTAAKGYSEYRKVKKELKSTLDVTSILKDK